MYITEQEAKDLSGYSRTTLYSLRKSGVIRWTASKTGRKIKYHKADILKFCGITLKNAA